MERHALGTDQALTLLLESTDESHVGYPVVLQPRSEEKDEIRLDEVQAQTLYERLKAYYRKRLARQVRDLLCAQLRFVESLEDQVGSEVVKEMRSIARILNLEEANFVEVALPRDETWMGLSDLMSDQVIAQSQFLGRLSSSVDEKAVEIIRQLLVTAARLSGLPFLLLPENTEELPKNDR